MKSRTKFMHATARGLKAVLVVILAWFIVMIYNQDTKHAIIAAVLAGSIAYLYAEWRLRRKK